MSTETRSAGVILDDATARTEWDYDSQIAVLLDYIQNQDDNATFAAYIAERVAHEEELSGDAS